MPAQPICSHADSGSGSVTIIDEFIGSQERFSPLIPAVNPSVARSTKSAATIAPIGDHAVRLDLGDRGLLGDGDAHPLDDVGETAHELGRLDPRAVRVVGAAEGVGDVDPRHRLLGTDQHGGRSRPTRAPPSTNAWRRSS